MAHRATNRWKYRRSRHLQCEPLEQRMLLSVTSGSHQPVGPMPPQTSNTGAVGPQGVEPINGVGNNPINPILGAANTNFMRLAPANFSDGIDAPNGQNLPSARVISNLIADQDLNGSEQDESNSRSMSDWVYAWGQFIDHDIDLTEGGTTPMNIPIPKGDPTFDPTGQGNLSIAFDRSQTAPGTGTSTSNPAQFVNQDTTFIDGSTIYGSDAATAAALRTFVGGQLKTSAGNLLPYNTMGLPMQDPTGLDPSTLFAAGDVRANENIELTNITTLFVREHNFQAAQLAKQHPIWTDQQLYDGARQIVIGEIQSITYNEWLPALMGRALAPYQGYNPKVDPSISVEFASAAYRLHTLLDDEVAFLDNKGNELASMPALALSADFFQPGIVAEPGELAGNLKYLATDNTQEVDEKAVDGLRNALFPDAPIISNVEVGASDLIADDIQRGRDEGDPTYNEARLAVGEQPVTSFAQITSNVQLQQQLQQIYGNVNNVELFVGLMGEDHLPGSSLGPTEQAILARQFEALRDGDRFFYLNADPPALANQLNNTTLAQIIERNTDITNLQSDVFYCYTDIRGTVTAPPPFAGARPMPVAGATVELVQDGQVIQTTKTNSAGAYQFEQVGAGQFTVELLPPANASSATGNSSGLAPLSANVDITEGQSGPADAAIVNFVVRPPLAGQPNMSAPGTLEGASDDGGAAPPSAPMPGMPPAPVAHPAVVDQVFGSPDASSSLRRR
jgi:peroxidase